LFSSPSSFWRSFESSCGFGGVASIRFNTSSRLLSSLSDTEHSMVEPSSRGLTYKDAFRIERARAIEAYALLEATYSYLLADLLGTTHARAGYIFFKVTNAKSRNGIVEDLVRSTYETEHSPFWFGLPGRKKETSRGIIAWTAMLDQERNNIVHWTECDNLSASTTGEQRRWMELRRPNFMYSDSKSTPIGTDHLVQFSEKCNFARLLIFHFLQLRKPKPPLSEDEQQEWREIFRQPILYPPPDAHPIAGRHKAP
jgi:hypothetical protein